MEVTFMPKYVTILGRKIPIKLATREQLDRIIPNAEGIWDGYNQIIYIYKAAPKHIQKYCLYHEIGHALLTFTGIDQTINPELQEIIVQSYATLIDDIVMNRVKINGK